jgi:arylsulfatase A-like enzyme
VSQSRPNLVFIFPDEYRQQAVGFMGQDPVVTPNLDRFASQGLVLTNAVSTYPLCSPYRAMLLTGKYPHSNGVITNCHSESVRLGCFLKENERCLSDVLKDADYSLGYIGKWHLEGPTKEDAMHGEGPRGDGRVWDAYTPPERRHGFDFWHSYGCCDRHLNPHYWHGNARIDEKIDVEEWSVRHETDVALDFIHNRNNECREAGKPFALFVSFNPPHMPFHEVPGEYLDAYEGKEPEDLLVRPNVRLEGRGGAARNVVKGYFAAITGIDEQFGRILSALDEEGLSENTIVVFSADHGEMMGSQGMMHKNLWYDESLLIPFIMRWPARIAPRTDDVLLGVPDTMPTLLGLMGLRDRIPGAVEGTDYSVILLGEDAERPSSALCMRIAPTSPEKGWRGIRTDRHTFVVLDQGDERGTFLYDNEEDPFQMNNVAADSPELVEELARDLDEWLRRTSDPWPTVS